METLPTRRGIISTVGRGLASALVLEMLSPAITAAQTFTPRERNWYSDPKAFWETADPKMERIIEAALPHFPASDITDLKIYTPFYLAGEFKFDIPWLLLWITHQEETTVSLDRSPDGKLYKGAMQRGFAFWPDRDAEESVADMSFLKELPQRYPTDAREIVWAASFIRAHTNRIQSKHPEWDEEECSLQSLYNYCAETHATSRINKYRRRKPIFTFDI
jgi:hypothetical protein